MAKDLSIIVAGGGIAGLTAALALASRGNRVTVLDKAERIQPIGAGIQLSPNAIRILDNLGVADALRYSATVPQGIQVVSARNARPVTTIPLGADAIAKYGLPYFTIHRPDLHAALLAACETNPDIEIKTSTRVSDATQHRNGVSILHMNGSRPETMSCDLLVGADGIWSTIRHELFAYKPAGFSGREAWRALIPAEKVPSSIDMDFTRLVLARNTHGVFYPVSAGRYLNLVIVAPAKTTESKAGRQNTDVEELIGKLGGWHSSLQDLMRLGSSWSTWPMFTITETRGALQNKWHNGSAVLIGDAAHGMLPFAAQGAAMGIEDAAILAECVSRGDGLQKALAQYSCLRLPRVQKVARLSRRNGELYHMGWPFSLMRDLTMRFTPPGLFLKRQDWIYRWRTQDSIA